MDSKATFVGHHVTFFISQKMESLCNKKNEASTCAQTYVCASLWVYNPPHKHDWGFRDHGTVLSEVRNCQAHGVSLITSSSVPQMHSKCLPWDRQCFRCRENTRGRCQGLCLQSLNLKDEGPQRKAYKIKCTRDKMTAEWKPPQQEVKCYGGGTGGQCAGHLENGGGLCSQVMLTWGLMAKRNQLWEDTV